MDKRIDYSSEKPSCYFPIFELEILSIRVYLIGFQCYLDKSEMLL